MFNEFPYTNYEKINLDWLLDLGNKLKADAESGEFDGERGKGIFGITTIYAGGAVGEAGYYCNKIGDAGIGDFVIGYGPAAGVNTLYLMKITSVDGNYLEGTTLLQITGNNGAPGEQGEQGEPGVPGAAGENGVSPVISVTTIQNGHRVTITDVNGTQSFDVINGDGAVIIDSALSTTSTNPVENRVITESLNAVRDNQFFKTPVEHKITILYSTVLENTRWTGATQATVNGYSTYLIPMENVPQQLFKCVINDVPYSGLYTDNGDGTYTSTTSIPNAQGFVSMYPDSNYTGWFVSTNRAIDWEFYTGVDVITSGGESCDRLGFKGVSYNYFPFITAHNGYPAIQFPNDENAVYYMDLMSVGPINYWYWTTGADTAKMNYRFVFTSVTNANKLLIPSVKNCISYGTLRSTWASSIVSLCKRGIYLYKLTDFNAIDTARKKLPVRLIGHGTNDLPGFMLSMANGWAGSEFDIRKTSDDVYIFSHDNPTGGINVETSTYEDVKKAIPGIMTFNEMLDFLSQFSDTWVDMHMSSITDSAERLNILRNINVHNINAGYYVGISGNIGNQTATTFYKTGIAYGFAYNTAGNAHKPTANDSIDVYKYFVYSGQDSENPYLYNMKSDSGEASYESIIAGTFDGFQFAQLYYDNKIVYPH